MTVDDRPDRGEGAYRPFLGSISRLAVLLRRGVLSELVTARRELARSIRPERCLAYQGPVNAHSSAQYVKLHL